MQDQLTPVSGSICYQMAYSCDSGFNSSKVLEGPQKWLEGPRIGPHPQASIPSAKVSEGVSCNRRGHSLPFFLVKETQAFMAAS